MTPTPSSGWQASGDPRGRLRHRAFRPSRPGRPRLPAMQPSGPGLCLHARPRPSAAHPEAREGERRARRARRWGRGAADSRGRCGRSPAQVARPAPQRRWASVTPPMAATATSAVSGGGAAYRRPRRRPSGSRLRRPSVPLLVRRPRDRQHRQAQCRRLRPPARAAQRTVPPAGRTVWRPRRRGGRARADAGGRAHGVPPCVVHDPTRRVCVAVTRV